jgi:hypothetical protein
MLACLSGVFLSCLYSERVLSQMTLEVIKHHLKGHKFIMDSSDQVPPDVDIKRVRMVTKLVEKHARYD